jgi:adenine-specific DNA methylase
MHMLGNSFRPIHYLGSKLRILEIIKSTVDDLCDENMAVADIFSGSGTVSKYLSYNRPVVAADIQEYSRVINTAILLPHSRTMDREGIIEAVNIIYKENKLKYLEIINFEKEALSQIKESKYENICSIMELGPLVNAITKNQPTNNYTFAEAINQIRSDFLSKGVYSKHAITMLYGGVYFSYDQAIYIDSCLQYLEQINEKYKYIFHAAILSSASDIVNTIGKQFAQPISPRKKDGEIKTSIMKKVFKDRSQNISQIIFAWLQKYNNQDQPKYLNRVLKGDFIEVIPRLGKIGVVYADPPYTRYHYSRYYHVLETIALRDFPEIPKSSLNGEVKSSKGVYRSDRHQSSFGVKSKSAKTFDTLFSKCSGIGSPIVLSYSPYSKELNVTPRIVTIDQIIDSCSRYYSDVNVISCGDFSHSKLNKSELHLNASDSAELLVVGKKPKG